MRSRLLTSTTFQWAGLALLALIGLIHLIEAPSQFSDATYKGLLFFANAAGCAVAVAGLWRNLRWAWGLGTLIAAATAVGYVWSRTVGLPGLPVDPDVFEPLGVVSVLAEVAFVGLAAAAFSRRSVTEETRRHEPASPERAA
jgi:hypothetical protein